MPKISAIIYPILFIIVTSPLYSQTRLGIYAGGNYYDKVQEPAFTPIDKNNLAKNSRIIFDNDGYSYQLGLLLKIKSRFGFSIEYRGKRTCEFDYPKTFTPYVYGPNTYWIKSHSSSWNFGVSADFVKFHKFSLNAGVGISHTKIEGFFRDGFVHPTSHKLIYISPEEGYSSCGSKKIYHPLFTLGVDYNIFKKFTIGTAVKYSSGEIKQWKWGGDYNKHLFDQQLYGMYYMVNLVYWII